MVQDLLKPMQMPYNNNITISIGTQNESDVRKWFETMKNGGQIYLPNARNALEQVVRSCKGQVRNLLAISFNIIFCSRYTWLSMKDISYGSLLY